MKITLIIPPTDLDKAYGDLQDMNHILPAIGPAYIAATLRADGFDVRVVDAYVQRLDPEEAAVDVLDGTPDVIGISLLTTSAIPAEVMIRKIRDLAPQVPIILGNIHASVFADDLLRRNVANYIVDREGEYTMRDLCRALDSGSDVGSVEGIIYLDKGELCTTPPRPLLRELDMLPPPAWDLFPLEKYRADPRSVGASRKATIASMPILATRGCPNGCTFCSSRSARSLGTRYRMRSPAAVADEMLHMHEVYGVENFFFVDLSFPLIKQHGIDVCHEIIARGLHKKITWRCEMRVKPISEDLLVAMCDAGCDRVMFGIESGSDEILKKIKKGFSVADVRHAVALCKKVGLDIEGLFMFGLPGETQEMAEVTRRFAIELDVRYASANFFVPYPGCDLYDELMDANLISMNDTGNFTSYPAYGSAEPVYRPEGWTNEDIYRFQKRFMKSFYFRPRFLIKQLCDFRLAHIDLYWQGVKSLLAPVRKN